MSGSKDVIYNSISFIEKRLMDELDINGLAEQAFFSKTHYQRLFQSVIGEPVMEYVKKRRLQSAGIALCETNASVLEIALQFGYTTHEGFSRAFKAHFGMPPLQYRKRYTAAKIKQYHEEVKNMITKEAKKNIARHTDAIAKDMAELKAGLEKWNVLAKEEIDKAGQVGLSMKVAFGEWENLTARIGYAKDEMQNSISKEKTVYDLYDKTNRFMKMLDDIRFQMNLLLFLTGVELARMGEHKVPFLPIRDGIAELCAAENNRKPAAAKLLNEINAQIQAEIKREAVSCIKKAAEELRTVLNEGNVLSEKASALVIDLGSYGKGFALIARETKKCVSQVQDAETFMTQLADKMEKMDNVSLSAYDSGPVYKIIYQLQNAAFATNLNAFNAAIETARSGEKKECVECAERVRNYAGQMQQASVVCSELYGDCEKLITLLRVEDKDADKIQFQKYYDDIIFQAPLLNLQMELESERADNDNFRALAHRFEKARQTLIQGWKKEDYKNSLSAVQTYRQAAALLVKEAQNEAEAAGPHGEGIAFIAQEYELFIDRVKSFCDALDNNQ